MNNKIKTLTFLGINCFLFLTVFNSKSLAASIEIDSVDYRPIIAPDPPVLDEDEDSVEVIYSISGGVGYFINFDENDLLGIYTITEDFSLRHGTDFQTSPINVETLNITKENRVPQFFSFNALKTARSDFGPGSYASTSSLIITLRGPSSDRLADIIEVEDVTRFRIAPEPLTILGAGTAIGFGASFKRKLAKINKK